MPGRFTGGINLTLDMNADEKSDKVIVPEKPSNDGGLPLAEPVEERTLPKRNTSQTPVVRTQRRVAKSSGLAGVRQAARQGKDVRFTPSITSFPSSPLRRSYSREEPSALVAPAGICAGGAG